MKKISTLLLLMVACLTASAQYQASPEILKARTEFQDNKFGIYIHWGLYSMLGNGEWVMSNRNINYKEYTHLADGFYPSKFDAEEWVKAFKAAGARYVTFTTRHHDGFSMFKTSANNYNIVDGTPFHRDVLKELADACQKYGIKLHLYYSHVDWSRPDYPQGWSGMGVGKPKDQYNYDSYLAFMKHQLTELLTNYGPIGAIWFDGYWDQKNNPKFDWRLDEQYSLIHRLQPSCLVANNHHKAPKPGEDLQTFEQDLPGQNTAGYSKGTVIGQLPLETVMTMNKVWGYDITDKKYKSSEYIIQHIIKAAGNNANYVINIGPRPDGKLPVEAVERLKAIGDWMGRYGETIYGTRGGIVRPHDWGVTTQKGNTLYVHIMNCQDRALFLPLTERRVASARMYDGHQKVRVSKNAEGVTLELPAVPKGVDTIVELTLK